MKKPICFTNGHALSQNQLPPIRNTLASLLKHSLRLVSLIVAYHVASLSLCAQNCVNLQGPWSAGGYLMLTVSAQGQSETVTLPAPSQTVNIYQNGCDFSFTVWGTDPITGAQVSGTYTGSVVDNNVTIIGHIVFANAPGLSIQQNSIVAYGVLTGNTLFLTSGNIFASGTYNGTSFTISGTPHLTFQAEFGLPPYFAMNPKHWGISGGSGTYSVIGDSIGTSWSISAPSWVHFSSINGSGSYDGTLSADPNTDAARTGMVTFVCGAVNMTRTITQDGLPPGRARLITPADGTTNQPHHAQFSWSQSVPAADWFELYITYNGSKYVDQWFEGATNWTPTADLPAGSYSWWVRTYNSAGLGPWSANSTFMIPRNVPAKILLVSPIGSAAPATTQLYTWQADAAAAWYELYVLQNGQKLCDSWFTLSDSVAQSGSGNFAVEVWGHTGGNYQWWVRGWSADGLGLWSDPGSYAMPKVLPPGPVTLLTPTNNANAVVRQPEFTWTASSPAADWYDLYVVRNGSKYLDQWVKGTTNWVATTGLAGGTYTWWVHPWNAAGYGPWSTSFSFMIKTTLPGKVTLVSPSGSVAAGSTQRYTWKADPAATWYELYVVRNGSAFGDHWYTLTDSVVDTTTGSFVVDLSGHSTGTYQWYVRGWGPDGLGIWSSNLTFQVP